MTKQTTILITGISGQDGYYLARDFSSTGANIIGTSRSPQVVSNQTRSIANTRVSIEQWDMIQKDVFRRILDTHMPDYIFNLAACTSGEDMDKNPDYLTEINGISVLRMLEIIRDVQWPGKFIQASSSEVFAGSGVSPQSELTPIKPRNIYGATKAYADNIIRLYREKYNVRCCSAYLFNHESPRREEKYVTQKICYSASRIKHGRQKILSLGDLDAVRDWGYAKDFARALRLIAEHNNLSDYVVATEKVHTVRNVCELAFSYLGLDYQDYVHQDIKHMRRPDECILVGNSSKIKEELGWFPKTTFPQMIRLMTRMALLNDRS